MFYEPEKGHGLPHNPFKALVSPRPIGWIATRSLSGQNNLAPYSFFNAVSDSPPIVMFSSAGEKDSLAFAEETGCFVAHSVSQELFQAMNQSSAAYARGDSEIKATGLKSRDGYKVNAPVLVDAPSALECVVTQIMRPQDRHGAQSNYWLVFGEVVGVHINDRFLSEDGLFDAAQAALMARGGYMDYTVAADWVAKARPSLSTG